MAPVWREVSDQRPTTVALGGPRNEKQRGPATATVKQPTEAVTAASEANGAQVLDDAPLFRGDTLLESTRMLYERMPP